VILVVTSERF